MAIRNNGNNEGGRIGNRPRRQTNHRFRNNARANNGNRLRDGKEVYLSVIIPAYNEEWRLAQTLTAVGDYLKNQAYSYEIIVVNDGSKDKTAQIAEGLIGKVARLKLIDNQKNRGKGFVVRQGLMAAKGRVRLFMDSDNSAPIEEIEKLLPYFKENYGIVIGSRHALGAKIALSQPLFRQFMGWGYRVLADILAGTWGIRDTQCGFKTITAPVAVQILPLCKIDGFVFDAEILMLAKMKGYRVAEVGVVWKSDARHTVEISSMFKMFLDLLRVRANKIKGIYGTRTK